MTRAHAFATVTGQAWGNLRFFERLLSPELDLAAIGQFRARQMALVEAHLPKDLAAEIDLLLDEKEETDGITRSRLAVLKQNSQSVRPMAVKARLANHTDLSKLFQRLEPVIEILGWDQNSSRSYALAVIALWRHITENPNFM